MSLGTRRSKIYIWFNWSSSNSWQLLMAALPKILVSKRCVQTGVQHHSHPEEQRRSDGWRWSQCTAGSFSLAPKEPKTIHKQNGFFSRFFAEAMRKRCGSTAEAGTPFPSRAFVGVAMLMAAEVKWSRIFFCGRQAEAN